MIFLSENIKFPDVSKATDEGLLAIGGDLSVDRLIEAYSNGIFPWFENDEPILWWTPDPRFVLFPDKLIVSKSMRKLLKKGIFEVTYNNAFDKVIYECSKIERTGQGSSWITGSMINAYCEMHDQGFAKSVEVWKDRQLVAGLYGIDLGNNVFSGESMFTKISNASKFGFITFVIENDYRLIDCQVYTRHLESLGAEMLPRDQFLDYLK